MGWVVVMPFSPKTEKEAYPLEEGVDGSCQVAIQAQVPSGQLNGS